MVAIWFHVQTVRRCYSSGGRNQQLGGTCPTISGWPTRWCRLTRLMDAAVGQRSGVTSWLGTCRLISQSGVVDYAVPRAGPFGDVSNLRPAHSPAWFRPSRGFSFPTGAGTFCHVLRLYLNDTVHRTFRCGWPRVANSDARGIFSQVRQPGCVMCAKVVMLVLFYVVLVVPVLWSFRPVKLVTPY